MNSSERRLESPSVDMGEPSPAGLGAADIDGEPRGFGTRADLGAGEYTGALVNQPPAAGNVGNATGANGPFDVLKINGKVRCSPKSCR